MAALRRLLWPPPRLASPLAPHQPFLGPSGRPAGTVPGVPGRPFSCREDEEGAVAEAAWRRRRRWGELSIAAAAGGGLVGLVCYQLYGDPRTDSARGPTPGRPGESAAKQPEDPPRARGLLPIPVAAAKETVCAGARARASSGLQVMPESWRAGVSPAFGMGLRLGASAASDIPGCESLSSGVWTGGQRLRPARPVTTLFLTKPFIQVLRREDAVVHASEPYRCLQLSPVSQFPTEAGNGRSCV